MIEGDESSVKPREQGDRYGESLLYDFSKFLISLSLLALGGLLTLSQAARQGDIKIFNVVLVVGSIAGAAMLCFVVANSLVDARARGKEPLPQLPAYLKWATALLGVGIGGFLMLWVDTLT